MTTGLTATGWLDRWERRLDLAVNYIPYIALVASAVLGWVTAPFWAQPARLPTLVISAAAGLWMLWWVTLHPAWVKRRPLMVFYYIGLLAFIAVLIARSPIYGFFAFSGYLHAVHVLWGRVRLVGV